MAHTVSRLAAAVALILGLAATGGQGQLNTTFALEAMPPGYQLQAYDDCGVPGRQPHIIHRDVHEYSPEAVNADQKARTVAWDWQEVRAEYADLDPALPYVVAITYANEPFNNRVQSLWAGEAQLHGPHALPKGGVERLLFRVPGEALAGGKLTLRLRLEAQVNVVVSVVELWAPKASPPAVGLGPVWSLTGDLRGAVEGLSYDPLPGAEVALARGREGPALGRAVTDDEGAFSFSRDLLASLARDESVTVTATFRGVEASRLLTPEDLYFEAPRYRPIPTQQAGLARGELSLDGEWSLDPRPGAGVRERPLADAAWGQVEVPGQWLQQGYDVPQDQPVAMARGFAVPRAWAGRRIILRLEAIHAGTRYWLNGRYLGRSENLYTPVEWDVTDAARPGRPNRLDLEMTVDTVSERLSYSSGYAFHNLGGIDRSVRLFALPPVHLRALHLNADLDADCRDGVLRLEATLENSTAQAAEGLSLRATLRGPDGRLRDLTEPATEVGTLVPGASPETLTARVPEVEKWSAEKPALYHLTLDLLQNGRLLERVEREVGFRKIEVRGSQLYVNGARIKLAGACHHETDPLTGRAGTARLAETDVRLLKAANLNYLRTSHYPPTDELLQAADRLGMYVEVEAPFCWVGGDRDAGHLRAVLTPTAAMVDYCHAHPSVLVWSVANESLFNPLFEESAKLVKELDPSRPTTFNNPDPQRRCDLANLHYAPMPFDQHWPDDPRPLLWGEYWFPVCHEQTDVRVNPGLRELWGAGHSAPDSERGRRCAETFAYPRIQPGEPPGTWTYMRNSPRVVGGAIWAALDEPFYLPDGRQVGYAWHHGFWGLIDGWRRPKPEWWLAKLIFSPVWFPQRQAVFTPGMATVSVPVENRYSCTDLGELRFSYEVGDSRGTVGVAAPPGATAALEVPIPAGVRSGDTLTIRVTDRDGALVTPAVIQLGERRRQSLPRPRAGAPDLLEEGDKIIVRGDGFQLALNRRTGELDPADPRHTAPVSAWPSPHLTCFDFGDLGGPDAKPYAVLPAAATRVVEGVEARLRDRAVEIMVIDHYDSLRGGMTWTIARDGMTRLRYDYEHTGEVFSAREVGVRVLLPKACDTLSWDRWSEWGVYPEDSISRPRGTARAHRDPRLAGKEGDRPRWPWALDETELGTADFRGVKLNVFEAALLSPTGVGMRVLADADIHVRACLDPRGVWLHILTTCELGPTRVKPGDRLRGEFAVTLAGGE